MSNEKGKMKIIFTTILLILLTIFMAMPVFARDRVVDNAVLLNPAEIETLEGLIASVASEYNFDLVIVTEESILEDKTPDEFAELYFKSNGYGAGESKDGCILVQVTDTRDYVICVSGRGEKILTPTAFNKLNSDIVKSLSASSSYDAYRTFIADWQEFLALDAKGRSYNFFHKWNVLLVVISWLIALGVGFVVVLVWKKGMNTALAQTQAQAYVVSGSLKYAEKKDTLLNSKTTKTKKQSGSSGLVGAAIRTAAKKSRGGKY